MNPLVFLSVEGWDMEHPSPPGLPVASRMMK